MEDISQKKCLIKISLEKEEEEEEKRRKKREESERDRKWARWKHGQASDRIATRWYNLWKEVEKNRRRKAINHR